ncbi:MAG TPA: antibiotic biosynthesis monooxygenase family protein [Solirubrobacteraceae bacterium]|jgi:quinol monooxygenase YgiN|nr:antibiotic biosynthesis monooxygenase family protein [Solirubrobacteraceae bacterium]
MAGRIIAVTRIHGLAGRRDELRALMRDTQRRTAGEPGCLRYVFGATVGDADEYVHVQEWSDDSSFASHQRSEPFRDYQQGSLDLVARPSDMELHHVSSTIAPEPSGPMDPRSAD